MTKKQLKQRYQEIGEDVIKIEETETKLRNKLVKEITKNVKTALEQYSERTGKESSIMPFTFTTSGGNEVTELEMFEGHCYANMSDDTTLYLHKLKSEDLAIILSNFDVLESENLKRKLKSLEDLIQEVHDKCYEALIEYFGKKSEIKFSTPYHTECVKNIYGIALIADDVIVPLLGEERLLGQHNISDYSMYDLFFMIEKLQK